MTVHFFLDNRKYCKKAFSILNRRIKIILTAILLLIVAYFWPSALGGNTEIMIVQGDSMLPTILPGSLVIAQAQLEYQIDDIVAFAQREGNAQRIVVHRIIDETERGFIIKGDNNPKKDPGFHTSDIILGRVVLAAPYVGDLLGAMRDPIVLIITGLVLAVFQMEQSRRKKKKEKLRRIRLGITKQTASILEEGKKKQKKPDYTLFIAAIGFNIITYLALLFTVSSGFRPAGDVVTGFLFNMFDSTYAATISFAIYFVFIIGLYFLAKLYEAKAYRTKAFRSKTSLSRKKSKMRLLLGKEFNPMLAVASFLWLLFILMSLYHLMAIYNDLATILG